MALTEVPGIELTEGGRARVSSGVPLCVDLDGSLSNSDTLWDLLLIRMGAAPWNVLQMAGWLRQGKAVFKARLAASVNLEDLAFSWNESVLGLLEADADRPVYLVTGADAAVAREVCRRLPRIDGWLASGGGRNLTGRTKAESLVRLFGEGGFDYVGNHRVDVPVWQKARVSYLANVRRGLSESMGRGLPDAHTLNLLPARAVALAKGLRPHQWVKNLLVFVPLLTAQLMTDGAAVLASGLMFMAFCAAASAFYLYNDLMDVHADRRHPAKRRRPLAAGVLDPLTAVAAALVLSLAAVGLAGANGMAALLALAVYVVLNASYTLRFKGIAILDVLTLGGLYTIRIIGGAAATGTALSSWLLAFSVFAFLSLGLAKRYTELLQVASVGGNKIVRRGYQTEDLGFVQAMGMASAFAAALVFALYISSEMALSLYAHPEILWGIVPALLYGICRVWMVAGRGQLHHDPVVFVVRDPVSFILGGWVGLVLVFAKDPFNLIPL